MKNRLVRNSLCSGSSPSGSRGTHRWVKFKLPSDTRRSAGQTLITVLGIIYVTAEASTLETPIPPAILLLKSFKRKTFFPIKMSVRLERESSAIRSSLLLLRTSLIQFPTTWRLTPDVLTLLASGRYQALWEYTYTHTGKTLTYKITKLTLILVH